MSMPPQAHPRGFTLIEILVVLIIIGILAAIVIPRFASASREARINAFVADIDTFSKAMTAYTMSHGYPPDSSTGALPTELEDYIQKSKFEKKTPIGGYWDTELRESGIISAVGVHFSEGDSDDDLMLRVDKILDDGNLSTGGFREIATDRYYAVFE